MVPRSLRWLLAWLVAWLPVSAQAAPFAMPNGRALPKIDFDRHVQALLSKRGCSTGGCHGWWRGKGGLSLSLFSVSPGSDYEEITRAARGRRVDFGRPGASLFLLKALGHLGHQGGPRLKRGSWEHRLLQQWIEEGAVRERRGGEVLRLSVVPARHFFASPKKDLQLRVFADFAGGAREDVTLFTEFHVSEPEVVAVTPEGKVRALQPGHALVMARYRNQVAAMTALVPWPAPKVKPPAVPEVNFIDREVFALLRKLNLPPSGLSDDSEFLRRVYIDVTGSLPTPEEARAFLASKDAAKRQKKIDQLLNHPRHADLWALRFAQFMGPSLAALRLTGPGDVRWEQMAHEWFRRRVQKNARVDGIFRDVLLATSRDGLAPEAWVAQVGHLEQAAPFNLSYRYRLALDLFWRTADLGRNVYLEEMADNVASAFLGAPLECARCHHHPLAPWTSADRRAFANVFGQVQVGASPEARDVIAQEKARRQKFGDELLARLDADMQVKRAVLRVTMAPGKEREIALAHLSKQWKDDRQKAVARHYAGLGRRSLLEVFVTPERPTFQLTHPQTRAPLPARILGGPAVSFKADARVELFRFLTDGAEPWLAQVFVNRVWRHYFGRGLVEPDNVFVPANPSTHPALLAALTRDFVAHGYNLRRLERTILLSRTYQLSSAPVPGNEKDRWFPSHSRGSWPMFAVGGDLMADALGGHEELFPTLPAGRRLIEVADVPWVSWMFPGRDKMAQIEALDRLLGGKELSSRCREDTRWATPFTGLSTSTDLSKKSKRLRALLASNASLDHITEELFLGTLTRFPTARELAFVRAYVQRPFHEEPTTRAERWGQVLWALVNTKEFLRRR